MRENNRASKLCLVTVVKGGDGYSRGSEKAKIFVVFIKEIWQSSHIVKKENGTSKKE